MQPLQPLEVQYAGVYAQDDWSVLSNLKVVAGVRLERLEERSVAVVLVPGTVPDGLKVPNPPSSTVRICCSPPVGRLPAGLPGSTARRCGSLVTGQVGA